MKKFFLNISEDEVFERSYGVAYNFILATFPAIIFIFTLIPFVAKFFPTVNNDAIMDFLQHLLPESMYEVIASTIFDILSVKREGLLTFGFLFSAYLATNGMKSLIIALNACYHTSEKRGVMRMQLTAIGLTLLTAAAFILSVVFLVIGQIVLNYLIENIGRFSYIKLNRYTIYGVFAVRFSIVFLLFYLSISCIYFFGPAIRKNWRFFSPGSFLATFAVLSISYGFSFYITHFGGYNKVYGSIGAVIALMAWIQLITLALLLGHEVNATLHQAAANIQKRKLGGL